MQWRCPPPPILCICAALSVAFEISAQTYPYPRSVEERVAEATLIVVGKLRDPHGMTKHSQSCRVGVEQILFGAIPTNKTLIVSYTGTARFYPGVITPLPKDQRYLCFVTSEGVEQESDLNYLTRAVGKSSYAHDAFQPATEKEVWYINYLLEKRKKSEWPGITNQIQRTRR